jgi:adenylyltransferase/sulfurtransferase
VFEGLHHQSYLVSYQRREDCPAHDRFEPIVETGLSITTTRAGDLLERVRSDLGAAAIVECNQDLLRGLRCDACATDEALFSSLGKVTETHGRCPSCGAHRAPQIYHTINGSDPAVLDQTLESLGVPPWDILCGRAGLNQRYYEFNGDRERVLGVLADMPKQV